MTIQHTPIYALPYPQTGDTPDAPRDFQALAQRLESVISQIVNSYIPIGTILMYGPSGGLPSGWVLCDGSEKPRDPAGVFSALFNLIGTTYGTGNGSTTFNVPDLRGRSPVGTGTGNGGGVSGSGKVTGGTALTARSIGQWSGEERHLVSISEMPSHDHPTTPIPTIIPLGSDWNLQQPFGYPVGPAFAGEVLPRAPAGGNFNLNSTKATDVRGGNQPHNITQPIVIVNFIIKYANV